jgi:hypothetical protein
MWVTMADGDDGVLAATRSRKQREERRELREESAV